MATTMDKAPLTEARFLKPSEVMRLIRIEDRANFWAIVHRAGLPHVRFSERKILFEESAVRAFIDARTIGKTGGES
jgi:hypothetical protein